MQVATGVLRAVIVVAISTQASVGCGYVRAPQEHLYTPVPARDLVEVVKVSPNISLGEGVASAASAAIVSVLILAELQGSHVTADSTVSIGVDAGREAAFRQGLEVTHDAEKELIAAVRTTVDSIGGLRVHAWRWNFGGSSPSFPWPPPKWSARFPLPEGLVTRREREKLHKPLSRILLAMQRAHIDEWSIYAIGNDGFAVVTPLECIDDDGYPKAGQERWTTEAVGSMGFNLTQYLRSLVAAQRGRYRVLIFTVTNRVVTPAAEEPSLTEMRQLSKTGPSRLSQGLADAAPSAVVQSDALIYEFLRPSEVDSPRVLDSSSVTPTQHLTRAGLWRSEELEQH